MTALQTLMSRLGIGENGKDAAAANDRRSRPDRRSPEPRDNIFLLHGTESRLKFAARAVGFGTYDLEAETGEINASPELRAIAGLPLEDEPLSLEEIGRLIHPDDRARMQATFEAALDPHGHASDIEEECRLLRPDGTVRQIKVKGRTLFFGHGSTRRLLGATGIVLDITASRAADELLLQQARLLDLAPTPLLAWDERHGIVFWNAACERIYGYPREEALGRPCHELLRADFAGSRQSCLDELARDGRWRGRIAYLARDGRRIEVEASLERLADDGRVRIVESDCCLGEVPGPAS